MPLILIMKLSGASDVFRLNAHVFFQAKMLRAAMEAGWSTAVESDAVGRWSFPGALLYSGSLVTTVGKRLWCLFSTKKILKLICVAENTKCVLPLALAKVSGVTRGRWGRTALGETVQGVTPE